MSGTAAGGSLSLQARLKAAVIAQDTEQWQKEPGFAGLHRVGGLDLSYVKGDESGACASLVVLSYPQLQVLLVDGNGLLHHRGFGVACHLGVLTDLPCIGVAKNLLQVDGLARDELHREQIRSLQMEGDTFPLTGTSGNVLGMVLRSCNSSSKPLYVSVGHRVCLETAVSLVKSCCRYRIPEPIRQVQRLGELRKGYIGLKQGIRQIGGGRTVENFNSVIMCQGLSWPFFCNRSHPASWSVLCSLACGYLRDEAQAGPPGDAVPSSTHSPLQTQPARFPASSLQAASVMLLFIIERSWKCSFPGH
uniref:Endonuclease V n=1 Tax=Nothoprocta perdicaria TaxID=30464 RepID=A0A8C6ZHC4_NOTPE